MLKLCFERNDSVKQITERYYTANIALSAKLNSSVDSEPFPQCFFEPDVMQAGAADGINTNTHLPPERLLVG